MAEFVLCEKQELSNIAEAIRSKTGSADKMHLDEMAGNILSNIDSSGPDIEFFTVTFPVCATGDLIYYVNSEGVGTNTYTSNTDTVTIEVVKNSIVLVHSQGSFDSTCYIVPSTALDAGCRILGSSALLVRSNVTLRYSEDAPT